MPSGFDAAVPFIVGAGFQLIGPFIGLGVERELKSTFTEWMTEAGHDVAHLGPGEDPASFAAASNWVIDAAQIVSMVLGPAVALLLDVDLASTTLGVLYLGTFGVAFCAFMAFVYLVPIDRYHNHRLWIFSYVTIAAVAFNGVLAGVAAVAA